MATIKSFTSLEQSKKLAEILPLESADMEFMFLKKDNSMVGIVPFVKDGYEEPDCGYNMVPCWSLTALLGVLPDKTCVYKKTYKDGRIKYQGIAEGIKELILKDNPIDACVAMVEKLNKLKML